MKIDEGITGRPAAAFGASGITETIQRALTSAGLDSRSGPMQRVTDTIEQALAGAGFMQRRDLPYTRGVTINATAREVDSRTHENVLIARPSVDLDAVIAGPKPDVPSSGPGEFLQRSFTSAAGSRSYKVYLPAGHLAASSEPVPMIVMLHGCTQSPDDFAAGTRMNALADEHKFIVVYPAQSTNANGQKCWNWFRTQDQARGSGEPAIIAGITREVVAAYRVDDRRIFVAGMSAGAAMAVILGATYPDLFAAVGAHSGLPYGAAHDMPSAFGAMRGGTAPVKARPSATVPTIVFHGDGDHTVEIRNAAKIVEHAAAGRDQVPLRREAGGGTATGGRSYSRTDYKDASNRVVVEQWTLHGAGHAWSGGSAAGSFTDPRGPDASKEMVRFFYSLPRDTLSRDAVSRDA